MVVSIASDHAGYELRQKVRKYLEEKGFEVLDGGAPNGTDSYSYVDAGIKVAEDVTSGRAERGIAICGTGIGISMACNKVKGIRCALCTSVEMGQKAKQHNNANILALGGRTTDPDLAVKIVDAWLGEKFLGQHHTRRIEMLDEM